MNFKRILRGPLIWVLLGLILLSTAMSQFFMPSVSTIDTSTGLNLIQSDKVEQVLLVDGEQRVDLTLKEEFEDKGDRVEFYYAAPHGERIIEAIVDADPKGGFNEEPPPQGSWFTSLLFTFLPLLIIVGLFWFLLMRMQGGTGQAMKFAKSKARLVDKDTPTVTFSDVAGVDEAVEEIGEIKEFLEDPARFQAVGAKIPKGVLLYGPPGTGKTLLARAVAGEAKVPFYSISGSDFVEMFVGVGASRVRDLFTQAKENSPSIIFVDEIDAVGRHRGAGLGGGHDEREQTLNQLLVEMDGFEAGTNVILIAATNRPDILDPALLRPGRFDRQIAVDPPDMGGRRHILNVHAKGKPMAPDIDFDLLARRTPGFTGADLANVLNEAALLTARLGQEFITNSALDEAIDRVVAGPQRRTRIMNDAEKKITAYHEGGHALVAAAMRHTDPVTKVTILPRGRALGYTMVMPTEDKYSTTRNELLDQLAYAIGGRVAEEIVFHDPTTGASSDIEKATSLARKMVMEYGMSERVGAIKLGQAGGEVFLGRDMGHERDYSEAIAGVIDEEVRRLVEAAHDEAWEVLNEYREVLDHLVLELLEKETLNQDQLAQVFAPVQKRELRPVWLSSQERAVSDIPPVAMPEKALTSDDPQHVVEQEKIDEMAPEDQAAAAHEGQRAVEDPDEIPEEPEAE
ncbi:MAG TPA: ATP-dependent zinc metalloprotease FtsH [Actinomycetales bacterium]|nr:ATP-dependent zinc metalloprotease FtsH [Actinomycetales bacterium]